ncbi:hypothetical protein [Glycomyces salinus]|uniref:hypothetical protein n=1 Tax=Glycomyces salinus TaxID=980294 RepID=UPI0018ED7BC0|nr:hypothetical protein [Glycomyces salinus]
MSASPTGELPEEFRDALPEQATDQPESPALSDEQPAPIETVGNGWLLLGIFVLVAVGVVMLLIFASGGNADSSMIL